MKQNTLPFGLDVRFRTSWEIIQRDLATLKAGVLKVQAALEKG